MRISRAALLEKEEAPREGRSSLPLIAFAVSLLALIGFSVNVGSLATVPVRTLCWATVVVSLFALAITLWPRGDLYRFGFIYLVVLLLFHFGATYLVALGVPISKKYSAYFNLWFYNENNRQAIIVSMVAVLAYCVGFTFSAAQTGRVRPRPIDSITTSAAAGEKLARAGRLTVVLGAVLFVGAVAVTAPQVLFARGSYEAFVKTVAGTGPVALGVHLVAFGAAMLGASPRTPARRSGLMVLTGFSVVALMIGARSAILYALVGFVVCAAMVHRMPKRRYALVALSAMIALLGLVQQFRGAKDDGGGGLAATFVSSLSEMGGSLRPVTETVGWLQSEGQYNGITYVAGLLRIFELVVGKPRPAADPRFAGTLVAERVENYQIGYSVVAEAYLNFRVLGVVVFFIALGALFGYADSHAFRSRFTIAYLGVLAYALTYQVRQASNIILTILILGAVVVYLARFLSRPDEHTDGEEPPVATVQPGRARDPDPEPARPPMHLRRV